MNTVGKTLQIPHIPLSIAATNTTGYYRAYPALAECTCFGGQSSDASKAATQTTRARSHMTSTTCPMLSNLKTMCCKTHRRSRSKQKNGNDTRHKSANKSLRRKTHMRCHHLPYKVQLGKTLHKFGVSSDNM